VNIPTLVDHLEAYLKRPEVAERMQPAWTPIAACVEALQKLCAAVGSAIAHIAKQPPSKGYEPFLVERGVSVIAARGMAALLVRVGKRVARESSQQRPAYDAIRFLAKPGRQARSIFARAKLLLKIWQETSIIETAFSEAGLDEFEFIGLLKSVVEGGEEVDRKRIAEIAAALSPRLSIPYGPKVSAPSAAFEFARRELRPLSLKRQGSRRTRFEEHVEALTEATRKEFGNCNFDSRPARRRLKRQRAANRPNEPSL